MEMRNRSAAQIPVQGSGTDSQHVRQVSTFSARNGMPGSAVLTRRMPICLVAQARLD